MTLLPFRTGRCASSTLNALLIVLALLPSATLTFAAPPASTPDQGAKHDNKEYTLARTFKVKEVSRYKVKATVNQDDSQRGHIEYVTNMVYHEMTKEIKPNGSAVLTSEFDSASVRVNGMDRNLTGSLPTITATIDKQGHVLDTKIEGSDPMITHMAAGMIFNVGQQGGFSPVKPIKVGDTWKFEQPAKEDIIMKVTGTATFLGMDTLNGMQTYKVKMVSESETTIDQPEKPGKKLNFKIHGEGIINFDTLSGKMVKMTDTFTSTFTSDGIASGKITREMIVTLVTSDDKNPKPKESGDKTDKPNN